MGAIVIGILLVGIGIYCIFFGRKKAAAELLEIQFQETKTIAEAREAVEAMADVDPNYREMVELKGFSACDEPPTTPFSRKQVAFYVAETYKVSEETYRQRDSEGNERMRTVKHEDKLSDEESGENLILKDNNGDSIIIEKMVFPISLTFRKLLTDFRMPTSITMIFTEIHTVVSESIMLAEVQVTDFWVINRLKRHSHSMQQCMLWAKFI